MQQYPLVRVDAFRIARVLFQVLGERTLLRLAISLVIRNEYLQHPLRATAPFARLDAPLSLGFELGEKGGALFSLAQR
jgi:hypothetical protein